MPKTKTKKRPKIAVQRLVSRAYAWKIQISRNAWMLCKWAAPDRAKLIRDGKPSPEAKIVRVKLTPG